MYLPPTLCEPPKAENSLEQIVCNDKIFQFIGLPILHESWSCNLHEVDIEQADEDSGPDGGH